MRNTLFVLCTLLLIASCTRNSDDVPTPPTLLLKRTVQRSALGNEMRVAYYNEQELVAFDTLFSTATRTPGMIYVYNYNSKGKRTRLDHFIPILYTAGYYWAFDDLYLNDTIPTINYRYLKGNQVAKIMHFYNASGKLIKDSTYHTPNYGTYTYLTHYTYDMSGRLASSLDLNDVRDTTNYTTYQYGPNWVEKSIMTINYLPQALRSYGQTITEYSPFGISSEKNYGGQPPAQQLMSEVSYTYDAAGRLLNKLTVSTSSPSQEERYFYDGTTGKLEKIQYYGNGQLSSVTTYYYE
jgi:hypothetical protein